MSDASTNPINPATGTYIDDVHRDAWHWRAHYDSLEPGHEVLDEYDPATGKGRGFAAIDQTRLAQFELVSQRADLPSHALTLLQGSRPIFFRRRVARLDATRLFDMEGVQLNPGYPTITVLGWQRTVKGKNVKALVFFLEDGSCICADDPDAVNWAIMDGMTVPMLTTPAN